MNPLLTLKGNSFTQIARPGGGGSSKLPKGSEVTLSHLQEIHQSLEGVKAFWENESLLDGILITAYYRTVVAKSNRLNGYLSPLGSEAANESIVGAKFNEASNKHIITHYITREVLDKTIDASSQLIELFKKYIPSGKLTKEDFQKETIWKAIPSEVYGFTKTRLKQWLRDSCFLETFGVETVDFEVQDASIVTFFNVHTNIKDVLEKLHIHISESHLIGNVTALLDAESLQTILDKAPYLIAMVVKDFQSLSPSYMSDEESSLADTIPSPAHEPIIGVIDTLFDERVYFNEWVEYHDCMDDNIPKDSRDFEHGTSVTSLIVDGHRINPQLDDGCGYFRVRHFGVAVRKGFNSFFIINMIRKIVSENLDIKVWNLSLGANEEIHPNFISVEGAALDQIQSEFDVIFIVAGTNAGRHSNIEEGLYRRIGAPADSLNSIVVSSVDSLKNPAHFTREGIVLSFFIKPDIAYYGGGNGEYITVCGPLGALRLCGTSFAAPYISRKMAFLIHTMGLNREEAKALLIDSAISWNDQKSLAEARLLGNGIPPIRIEEILGTKEDEIKFVISDVSEKYNSYNYNFPIPMDKGTYPFVARATMCYFPKCSRNQGVDYTNTELSFTFGRLKKGEHGFIIDSIHKDKQKKQGDSECLWESEARSIFRKWDNVKHISNTFTPLTKPKKVLNPDNPLWGMSVKSLERLHTRENEGIRFGIVVTLKELQGVNRIDEFIQMAALRGWIVNQLTIDTQINIYNALHTEVTFE